MSQAGVGSSGLGDLRVDVLGSIRVQRGGAQVRLGPRLVELLAVLVLEARRLVPASRITDLLWGERAPAPATLRSHVSHLRQALAQDRDSGIVATAGSGSGLGYRLDLPPDCLDAWHFERGCAEGRRLMSVGEAQHAVTVLGEALALWRGPAYHDVADRPFVVREIARLNLVRRAARRTCAEALSALGRYPEATAFLSDIIPDDPYDEGLRRALALAMYADRRVDEAAQVCREGLTLLGGRGIDAPELQQLQRAILKREIPPAEGAGPPLAPCLLPPDPPWFVGREEEAGEAQRHLCGSRIAREPVVVIGQPGVGKTTFAVRVAHMVAEHFPDGQLYANLRGFDPAGTATSAEEVVRGFLDALQVPASRIPSTLEAQTGLYRKMLTNKRMLVVLDNAHDAAQVRPLLPGSPRCAVLVTSRDQMSGLTAADGARPLVLDPLTPAQAQMLLTRRLGAARLLADPPAADEIVAACAGLPLALAVVAARAAVNREASLRALATALSDTRVGLDAFDSGDAATDVRAVFSWSYRALGAEAARLFRLLGLYPGPTITIPAAARLADLPVRQAHRLSSVLTRVHMLTEQVPGRFSFHDLLRAYATELVHALDAADDRAAAQRRIIDHYLHTAHRAAQLLDPHRDPIPPAVPGPPAVPTELTDHSTALAWFTAEHRTLLGTVELAVSIGLDTHAWRLAWSLETFFDYRGHWHDWAATQRQALAAAQRLAEASWQAGAHRSLGRVFTQMGRLDDGYTHFRHALEQYGDLGDAINQAHTHRGLGWICDQQARQREALDHNEQALALYRQTGHRAGQAMALNNAGWLHAMLGDSPRALDYCGQAVALNQEVGDRHAEGGAWDSLGYAHHQLGRHADAIDCYQRALDLIREVGDRFNETGILNHLGDTHLASGNPSAARSAWQQALRIADEIGHAAADQIRGNIRDLDPDLAAVEG